LLLAWMSTESDPKEQLPFPTSDRHGDAPAAPAKPKPEPKNPSEDEIDHGIEESFPASDPVSVNVTRIDEKKP
jgi:hypothetical protein